MKAYGELVSAIGERTSPEAERSVGAPLGPRLSDVLVTAGAGEVAVSVENLCANLYEYEVALTPTEHKTLTELAERSGAGASAVEILQLLDPSTTPSP